MRPADYLVGVPPLRVAIVEHAHDDIGEGEDIDPATGRGTNRSAYVDRVNQRFGSPLGSYWCANAASGWWKDAGAALPPEPGRCESWRQWAFRTNRFRSAPQPGYAVLYGEQQHASHIGVVAKLVPDPTAPWSRRVVVIEGNASLGQYNRDGWIVAEKIMDATHLIGFVAPLPSDP